MPWSGCRCSSLQKLALPFCGIGVQGAKPLAVAGLLVCLPRGGYSSISCQQMAMCCRPQASMQASKHVCGFCSRSANNSQYICMMLTCGKNYSGVGVSI